MIADTAKSIGYVDGGREGLGARIERGCSYKETIAHIVPLLEKVVNDDEFIVREHVALQFPELCRVRDLAELERDASHLSASL